MPKTTSTIPLLPKVEVPTLRLANPTEWDIDHNIPAKPTAITLFSGLGSSSLALWKLGFNVLAHDFMREACTSLNANGFDVVQGDIKQVDFTRPRYSDVQVVVGGPPCQPFSQVGRNAGHTDARDMIPDFLRAVAHTLPRLFILENVAGLASPRHKAYLERRIAEAEALGYAVRYRVLDAADHGVSQNRKRLFVLGIRLDFLDDVHTLDNPIRWPHRERAQTMAEALGWDPDECIRRNQLAPEPARVGGSAEALNKALWPMNRPSTTVVGSFRPEVQATPGYRQAGDGPRQNAPGSVVTTQAERLILQGMPVDWKIAGSKSKVDLQIGNSCPNPLLVRLLAANLR